MSKVEDSEPRFPIRTITGTVALTIGVLLWFGGSLVHLAHLEEAMHETDTQLRDLRGTILHLGESRAMSARLAVETNDPAWRERYDEIVPQLGGAIQNTLGLSSDGVGPIALTKSANDQLTRFERTAFDLLGSGRRDEARKLLGSEAYQREQHRFASGMDGLGRERKEHMAETLETHHHTAGVHLLAVALVVPLLLVGWIAVIRVARRSHRVLAARNLALSAINSELDQRVEERTRDLELSRAEAVRGMQDAVEAKDRAERAREALAQEVLGRLEAQEALRRKDDELRHLQKMDAVGQLAGGVAHDFNNLLTVILGNAANLAESRPSSDPVREEMDEIVQAAQRGATLTRQLLAFSRKQVLQPHVLCLNRIVEELRRMLGRLLGETIDLSLDLEAELMPVLADPGQIEQVLVNLCVNARDAMPRGGKLILQTRNSVLDETAAGTRQDVIPGRYVEVAVIDSGIGMSPEVRGHLFEPFFTTKGPSRGSGLGLSTAYGIVTQSGGHFLVASEPDRGSEFRFLLPVATGDVERPMSGTQPKTHTTGKETILVVDDEESIRNLIRRSLSARGYSVLVANGSVEARSILSSHPGPIDMLVTDVVMPHQSGPELARVAREELPSIHVLLMSGYTQDMISDHGVLDPAVELIEKPFTGEALATRVRALIDRGTSPVRAGSVRTAGRISQANDARRSAAVV